MSKDQTTQPTPRIKISVDKSPAPQWAGLKFECQTCGAEYQLEAADKCRPAADHDYLITPACWTCGMVRSQRLSRRSVMTSNCSPIASQLDHEAIQRIWAAGVDFFFTGGSLESKIQVAYLEVKFLKNVWRGPGHPRDRRFKSARAKLARLKKRRLTLFNRACNRDFA